jgi:hypothetical protein
MKRIFYRATGSAMLAVFFLLIFVHDLRNEGWHKLLIGLGVALFMLAWIATGIWLLVIAGDL